MINEYTKNEIKGIILELKRLKTEHDKQIYTAVKRINEKKKYMDIMLQNLLGYFNTEYKNQNY